MGLPRAFDASRRVAGASGRSPRVWYNRVVPLLECVPNVSEGRDRAAIGAMAERIRATPGVRLLDVHSDAAHHRSVFTFVGSPATLPRAVVALCEEAARRIDLRRHAGVHPRIGALDVVPFVPLRDATMDDAVAVAHATGVALAARIGLPVIYYEHAASAPHRRPLEDVRRGGVDTLAVRLASAAWRPDAGPAVPHPTAGAVAVGARALLVAFNVQLASQDLGVARAVAERVRARNGGLPGVKAMGVPLPPHPVVQVSMNLTDLGRTRPVEAFAAVAAAAAGHGVEVVDSELVGLAPASAITPDEAIAMRIRGWTVASTLEWHLDQGREARR